MNTVGVVALAFIAGIFLIVIVLAVIASLWVAWDNKKQIKALRDVIAASVKREEDGIAAQVRVLESGKSAFQNIRADLVKAMEAQTVEMRETFRTFEESFKIALKNLNGKALLEAAKQNIVAMRRLDEVATALHELVMSANETQSTAREWQEPARADEHAPEGASRVQRSIYASDQVDEAETAGDFNAVTGDLFT
jgi:hypothetical protein